VSRAPGRGDLAVLGALAALRLALHLATARGYGIFGDELYYLACADHPAWGYVDHPPLSIALLRLWCAAFGDSLVSIRIVPALAGAASVFVTGLIARELGGGRAAQVLAALAAFFAPFLLAVSHFYSLNALDVLFWAVLLWLAVRILERDQPRLWLAFGALAGLGLENKYSVAFLGFGLVVGLVATRARKHLLSRYLWAGGALAALLFAPHLVWEARNGAPTLEFMRNASELKNYPVSPREFLGGQLLLMHPLFAPLWLAGLGALLLAARFARVRALGVAYLALLALMIEQKAKVYYLGPVYPVLFAAGAVAVTELAARRRVLRALPVVIGVLLVAAGGAIVPLAIPTLSPERYLAYSAALGVEEPRMERGAQARMPQVMGFYFGWPELAEEVARVYRSLSPEDRAHVAIFGRNYAEAGAIDYYGRALGLPRAISAHNSYWTWGPGVWDGTVLIVIGAVRDDVRARFDSFEERGRRLCEYCRADEDDLPIYVARGLHEPVSEAWTRIRHYE
jgi:dolichyl-phosphate-mannose-protein mannosyltransferase